MGHWVESGYGLVDPSGNVELVDSHATPLVVSALRNGRPTRAPGSW
jgi:hypothetical protein